MSLNSYNFLIDVTHYLYYFVFLILKITFGFACLNVREKEKLRQENKSWIRDWGSMIIKSYVGVFTGSSTDKGH